MSRRASATGHLVSLGFLELPTRIRPRFREMRCRLTGDSRPRLPLKVMGKQPDFKPSVRVEGDFQ